LSISGTNTTTTINALGISLAISIANTDNLIGSIGITNINYGTIIFALSTIKLGISVTTLP
jgi:hypothetical protein